jgi:hypothetical protein
MAREENAKHVPNLPLKPVGRTEHLGDGWHRCQLVHTDLNANPVVPPWAEQVIDDLEALLALREVHGCDVNQRLKLDVYVIPEEVTQGNEVLRGGIDGGLLVEHAALARPLYCHRDELWHCLDEVVHQLRILELQVVRMMHVRLVLSFTRVCVPHVPALAKLNRVLRGCRLLLGRDIQIRF